MRYLDKKVAECDVQAQSNIEANNTIASALDTTASSAAEIRSSQGTTKKCELKSLKHFQLHLLSFLLQ